ncbi:MAG: isocitrate lyase/PEP mutase family protein [Candidatus Rokubacteria bacterium]|nr:isocitrate lyase/PEP mutase family protein [Candidatus Rokubacteria bacterium]
MRRTTQLRRLLDRGELMVAPLADCAYTAKIIEAAGFPAVYLSGGGTAGTLFGVPDAGLVTSSETMMAARLMVNAVNVPVIVDADTAYGNAVIATRTARDLIQAGAAAMQIEDQVTPKRCGWVAGKELVPLDEAVGKLRAAADVRKALDPDFVIVARTDARGAVGGGLDEALRRGQAYVQAGADLVFVEGLRSAAELDAVIQGIPGAHLNWSYDLDVDEVQRRGLKVLLFSGAAAAGRRAIWDFVHDLRQRGTQAHRALRDVQRGHPLGSLEANFAFLGFGAIREWEERYLPKEANGSKYEESLGWRPTRFGAAGGASTTP